MQDLVIENCPWLKKLNIRNNSLTNLEFSTNLESLEKLEIDYNKEINNGLEYLPKNLKEFSCEGTELAKILKLYQGD
jgi:Leucine-rich repeat (LRR) protein